MQPTSCFFPPARGFDDLHKENDSFLYNLTFFVYTLQIFCFF